MELRDWCWTLELFSQFMVYFVWFKAMLRCTLNLIPDAFTQKLWDFGRTLELEGVSKYNYSREMWRVLDPTDYKKLSHPIPELGEWYWTVKRCKKTGLFWGVGGGGWSELYPSMDSIIYA